MQRMNSLRADQKADADSLQTKDDTSSDDQKQENSRVNQKENVVSADQNENGADQKKNVASGDQKKKKRGLSEDQKLAVIYIVSAILAFILTATLVNTVTIKPAGYCNSTTLLRPQTTTTITTGPNSTRSTPSPRPIGVKTGNATKTT